MSKSTATILGSVFAATCLFVGGLLLYRTVFASDDPARQFNPPLVTEIPAGTETPDGMVWIEGGAFQMGSGTGARDEGPVHLVGVDGFWMDATEVTNAEFQRFVEATGYVTIAEKTPDVEQVRKASGNPNADIPDDLCVAGSICQKAISPDEIDPEVATEWEHYQWWEYVPGANWRHPEGEGSSIEDKMDHPVVHVAFEDVMAYCKWAGKRLPTEAQWEYASRGGLEGKTYPWGDELKPDGEWMTNIYQGEFPFRNTEADGYRTTAPVGSFPANDYGLHDMSGNVWEWTADWYQPDYYRFSPKRNPTGPDRGLRDSDGMVKKSQRGGSFLCADSYCNKYRNSARMRGELSSGTFHCGFRCVVPFDEYERYRNAPRQQGK